MVTSTSTVMGGDETPEQKAARIKAARQAGIEKARQAKAAKTTQTTGSHVNTEDSDIMVLDTRQYKFSVGTFNVEDNAWRQVFMIAMKNFEIKTGNELTRCSALADAAVAEMKKQGRL